MLKSNTFKWSAKLHKLRLHYRAKFIISAMNFDFLVMVLCVTSQGNHEMINTRGRTYFYINSDGSLKSQYLHPGSVSQQQFANFSADTSFEPLNQNKI